MPTYSLKQSVLYIPQQGAAQHLRWCGGWRSGSELQHSSESLAAGSRDTTPTGCLCPCPARPRPSQAPTAWEPGGIPRSHWSTKGVGERARFTTDNRWTTSLYLFIQALCRWKEKAKPVVQGRHSMEIKGMMKTKQNDFKWRDGEMWRAVVLHRWINCPSNHLPPNGGRTQVEDHTLTCFLCKIMSLIFYTLLS